MSAAVLLAPDTSRMVADLEPGEALVLPDVGVRIVFVGKSGRNGRLVIHAPRNFRVDRTDEAARPVPSMQR